MNRRITVTPPGLGASVEMRTRGRAERLGSIAGLAEVNIYSKRALSPEKQERAAARLPAHQLLVRKERQRQPPQHPRQRNGIRVLAHDFGGHLLEESPEKILELLPDIEAGSEAVARRPEHLVVRLREKPE